MTIKQDAPQSRWKVLPVFLGFVLVGALLLWFSLSSLIPSVHAAMTRAPLVTLWPRDAVAVPAAFGFFSFAAMMLFPPPEPKPGRTRGKRSKPSRRVDWLTVCFGAALVNAMLMVVAVPVTEIAALVVMPRLHYLPCPPARHYERHPPQRWILALSSGNCP